MNSLYVLVVCLAGAATAMQAPINARLRGAVESRPLSALISFVVGTILLALVTLLTERGTLANASRAPWWIWIGGALGALYVIATLAAVPQIGAAAVVASAVLGQLIAGIAIDSFGWFGVTRVPFSFGRGAGAVLLAAGVFLLQRR